MVFILDEAFIYKTHPCKSMMFGVEFFSESCFFGHLSQSQTKSIVKGLFYC